MLFEPRKVVVLANHTLNAKRKESYSMLWSILPANKNPKPQTLNPEPQWAGARFGYRRTLLIVPEHHDRDKLICFIYIYIGVI